MSGKISSEIKSKDRLLFFSLVTTFFSLVPTFYVAFISGSVTLYADFLRCLGEFIAILVSWLIFRRVSEPAPDEFNYGFGKLEQFAGLGVGIAMLSTFVLTLSVAVYRFIDPNLISDIGPGAIFAALSIFGNVYIWLKNKRANKLNPSPLTYAQAGLFKVKALISLIVFKSLLLSFIFANHSWVIYIDPAGSLIISLFVLRSASQTLSSSVSDLLDKALEEVLQFGVLKALVANEAEYAGFHGMRSRRAGGKIYVELFLEFNQKRTMAEVKKSVELIRAGITKTIPDIDLTIALSR